MWIARRRHVARHLEKGRRQRPIGPTAGVIKLDGLREGRSWRIRIAGRPHGKYADRLDYYIGLTVAWNQKLEFQLGSNLRTSRPGRKGGWPIYLDRWVSSLHAAPRVERAARPTHNRWLVDTI